MDPTQVGNFYTNYRITHGVFHIIGSTVTGGANPLTGYAYGAVFAGLPRTFSTSTL